LGKKFGNERYITYFFINFFTLGGAVKMLAFEEKLGIGLLFMRHLLGQVLLVKRTIPTAAVPRLQ
jgi:hypothetical protein